MSLPIFIVPALFIMASNSSKDTMDSLPQTVQNTLMDSGAFENFTESDVEEMEKERQEEARNPKPRRRYSMYSIQRLLGLMPPKELDSQWTEEDYLEHCAPKELESQWTEEEYLEHCEPSGPQQVDPWASMTEEDWAEYKRQQDEADKNEPWCTYCHPQSGCDGDHTDELNNGTFIRFLIRK